MRKRSTVRRRVVSAAGVVDIVVGLFANVAAAVLSGQSDDFASAAAAALRATNNRTLKPQRGLLILCSRRLWLRRCV